MRRLATTTIAAAVVVSAIVAVSGPTVKAAAAATPSTQNIKNKSASNLKMQSYAIGQNVAMQIGPIGKALNGSKLEALLREHLDGKDPAIDPKRGEQVFTAISQTEGASLPAGISADDVAAVFAGYIIGPSLNAVKDDVQLDEVFRGVRTTLSGKPELSDTDLRAQLSAFNIAYQKTASDRAAKLAETNKAEGAAFLAKNRTQPDVQTTASGLQYVVLRQGDGPRPSASQKVRVHYEGRLLNGTVFDSSYKRNDPTEFGLNQVIKGWTEGVGLMPTGSKYRFFIPSELAYGATPRPGGPIGPNATLIFDVELLAIVPN